VVDDLGDDGELAGRRSVVDQNDTSDLDETLEGRGGLSLDKRDQIEFSSVRRALIAKYPQVGGWRWDR
jgi:hypothetical protein